MVTIDISKGIPYKYEYFLIEKYHSYMSTCKYIEICYNGFDINYMLIYENGILIHLLIFANKDRVAFFLNSLIDIEESIIKLFVEHIFLKYPDVKKVEITSLYEKYIMDNALLISQREDYIVWLPEHVDEYSKMIGGHFRHEIKRSIGRLTRDFCDSKFIIQTGIDIDCNYVKKLAGFNHTRMHCKGIKSSIDSVYVDHILRYSSYYGKLYCIEADGDIIAGSVSYIIDNHLYCHILAFNNEYSIYSPGKLCMYYLLDDCIKNNVFAIHFLWGRSSLKERFLAKPNFLYDYYIYRSKSLRYYYSSVKVYFNNVIHKIKESAALNNFRTFICYLKKMKTKTNRK